MKSWNKTKQVWLSVATALLITAGASPSWGLATNTKTEGQCFTALTKALNKNMAAVTKAMAVCRNTVIATGMGSCPDATAQIAIDKAAKTAAKVAKKCQSACSFSGVSCIGSPFCPPRGTSRENCTAGAKQKFFESANMGFPGPFCESIIGGPLNDPEGFGTCVGGMDAPDPELALGRILSNELLDNLYGDLAATPSEAAASCLAALVKAAPKTVSKNADAVAKCRNTQLLSPSAAVLPDRCAIDDVKTAEKITKNNENFFKTVDKACTDAAIQALSLCGNGLMGTPTVAAAKTCLADALKEIAYSVDLPEDRNYADISVINGAYPGTAAPRCGDNLVNQIQSQFLLNGEECDGLDDSECPGECLPPGDRFECTCGNIKRNRSIAYGFEADLDNGWSGKSHNAKVTDGAGFVTDITNCDCDLFDPVNKASCVPGHSTDPVCDLKASVQPRCTHRLDEDFSCDEVGNENGANTDTDCRACDEFSENADDYCTGFARFCIAGTNSGDRCNGDDDCTGGLCTGNGACVDGPFEGNGCDGPEDCGVCLRGSNTGNPCSLDAQCPGASKICIGGANDGMACTVIGNCPGGECSAPCEVHSCVSTTCIGGLSEGRPCNLQFPCSGGSCAETSDCTAVCYDEETGAAGGHCASQTDCPEGQRCAGSCNSSNTCLKMRNGAPLPLSSEGTSVCIDSQFFTDVTGTRNIITGEHAVNYELRSVTVLSDGVTSRPCPVCGGFCAGGSPDNLSNSRCDGSCSAGPLECRYGPAKGNSCTTNAECGTDSLCGAADCRFDDDCDVCNTAYCNGGGNDGFACTADSGCPGGTCETVSCTVDGDCPGSTCGTGATCSGTASPECHGGTCRLDLACGGGPSAGQACRIEAYTAFGTTSVDCPPDVDGNNISGAGLAISWTPLTSGVVHLENPAACDAVGFENYDCNCVVLTGFRGATRTQPNGCLPACNDPDPDYYGNQCSALTTCVGGGGGIHGDGRACDEDSDCTSGDCSGNPKVCGDGSTGSCSVRRCTGGTNPGTLCTGGSQCFGGGTCAAAASCTVGGAPCAEGTCNPATCVTAMTCDGGATCDDACPNGRCTPLCLQRGTCTSGDREGDHCALDEDCPGGGTCVGDDPEEGACAQASFNHCEGPGWEFQLCVPLSVNTRTGCEWGLDGLEGDVNGTPEQRAQASDNNLGAGFCRADIKNCFVNDGEAEGGSTLNGRGDATNARSVATFCIPPSSSEAVNPTAGLPGPGRIRQPSLVVPNGYTTLP